MKSFTFLIIAFLFSFPVFGQEFAPVGAKWYYDELPGMGWALYDVDYILYTVEKDTSVNGQDCRKIIKRHDLDCYFRPKTEFVFSRNDSVFFYDARIDTFQLLYNFNAKKDESWSFIFENFSEPRIDTMNVHVDSTGVINVSNQVLRVLYVSYTDRMFWGTSTNNSTIIEKMGDIYFMFNFYPFSSMACDGNLSRGLRCYQDSNISYHFPSMETCDYSHLWNSVNSNKGNEIIIYPNPVGESIQISGISQHSGFRIYDTHGSLIRSGEIEDSEIMTGELSAGIYILRINDIQKNDVFYRKILKY